MTIRISLGNVGSGKTVCEVREMFLNEQRITTYSNIITKLRHQKNIKPEMIIKQDVVDHKKNRKTGKEEPVYQQKLNMNFWKDVKKPINVVLDEAHSIMNSRRSMSKTNVILTDWLALIRRILGSSDAGHGELVLITQLPNRIDVIARDMANQVKYHKCWYQKTCKKCSTTWQEHSEMPERLWICPSCTSNSILKHNHIIEVWKFASMDKYKMWSEWGMVGEKGNRPYYDHHFINDIEDYFPLYDTLQWDNLFSEFY